MLRFRTELEARQVWRALNRLSAEGQLDERNYVVICLCPQHGVEMLVVLAVGADHEAQIAAIVRAGREYLDLNIQCREMPRNDYEPHALMARMARSQDN